MGLLEEIDKLELSDEQKDKLRQEYGVETSAQQEENARLRRRNQKTSVEQEIKDLGALGFSEAPGLLKFVRRVYLSDDQEPGAVLLSDDDMELEGDERTGARKEEEISVAGAVREFIKLLPRNNEGKLALSDQAFFTDDHGQRNSGDDEEQSEQDKTDSRKRVESALGRPIERKRTRFQGTVS